MTTAPEIIVKPEMEDTHYGIQVCHVGEDGDMFALGHPGIRRAFAAFNRHARVFCRLANLADDRGAQVEDWIDSITEHWVILRKPNPDNEHEDPDWEWVADWVDADTPHALAVTLFRVD